MSLNFFYHSLIEFGPLTIFFLASSLFGFYPGATALVISVVLTTLLSIVHFRRVSYFSLVLSGFIFTCGVATIYLHNPLWLVLEYTIANLFFAIIQLYGHYKNKLVLKDFFGHMLLITDNGWRRLNWNWGVLFLITAILNQLFWSIFQDENMWVMFRVSTTFFMFLFGAYQFRISAQERLPGSSAWGVRI